MVEPIVPDYTVQYLFPPAVEDFVPADHPARFIREFVDALCLEELKFTLPACKDGRPPYAPSLLLKVWLYGYYARIRSTRKLEAACREHVSLLWLTGMHQPDHNTLWRFWSGNKEALREVFKQSVQLAVRSGCVGLVLQAVDGTKIAAASSSRTGWTKPHMERLLAALEESLQCTELQIAQENGVDEATSYKLPAGLTERQRLRDEIKAGLTQLAEENRQHYHRVEPEARRMNVGHENRYAYNAQAVTDARSGVIMAAEVTREETDQAQLTPMIAQVRETVGVAAQSTETLADGGYGAGAEIKAAAEQAMPVVVRPAAGGPKDNGYSSANFHYDEVAGTVTCPQKRPLDFEGSTTHDGRPVQRYRCHHQDCPVRAACTRDPRGRQIEVHPHTPAVQQMRQKLDDPQVQARLRLRSAIVEPTFARVKQHDGFRRFTVWGHQAVRAQWAMLCTVANLRIIYHAWLRRRDTPPSRGTGTSLAACAA